MSDGFISYSRHDQPFVRRLYEAFTAADRQVWVDLKDIPPTAEWLQEVDRGIDEADAFICVLSPEWIASTVCQHELEHALAAKKRLIPLLRRSVSDAPVQPAVRARNWIAFQESDDFEHAFATLVTALDTDLDYVRADTRLLVKAREWETKGCNPAFTLHGSELEEAERWLAQGADKQPSPTALHVQYITASRRATNRRQRFILISVSIALVVAIVLGTVAFVQSQIAQAQTRLATARQLVAEGNVALLQNRQDQALLLDLAAQHLDTSLGTRSALLSTLEYSPHVEAILQPPQAGSISMSPGGVSGLAFTPDGKRLVVGDAGRSGLVVQHIITYDVATHQALSAFPKTVFNEGDDSTFALSPDGKTALFGGYLWDMTRGTQRLNLNAKTDPAAFTPDSSALVLGVFCPEQVIGGPCLPTEVDIIDVATGHVMRRLAMPGSGLMEDLAVSPDGGEIAASVCTAQQSEGPPNSTCPRGVIWLWNAHSGQLVHGPLSGSGHLAFSPDGRLLAAETDAAGVVEILNAADGTIAYGPFSGSSGPFAFSPDSRTLATGGNPGPELWDLGATPSTKTVLPGHGAPIDSLAFSPDGLHLASGDHESQVMLWNLRPGSVLDRRICTGTTVVACALDARFSPDGKALAVIWGDSGSVALLDLPTGTLVWRDIFGPGISPLYPGGVTVSSLRYTPDGKLLAVLNTIGGTNIALLNTATGAQVGQIAGLPGSSTATLSDAMNMAISPNGHLLAASTEPVAFSPDGRTVATAGRLTLWNLPEGTFVRALPPNPLQRMTIWSTDLPLAITVIPAVATRDVAFSPDGRLLATIDDGPDAPRTSFNTVTLWNTQTARPSGMPLPNEQRGKGFGPNFAFSPDGRYLVVAYGYVYAEWDLQTRQLVSLPLEEPDILQLDTGSTPPDDISYGATSAQFSPDGTLLAVADEHGVSVWTASFPGWETSGCSVADHVLSRAQWDALGIAVPYVSVCPGLPADE